MVCLACSIVFKEGFNMSFCKSVKQLWDLKIRIKSRDLELLLYNFISDFIGGLQKSDDPLHVSSYDFYNNTTCTWYVIVIDNSHAFTSNGSAREYFFSA